MSIKRMITIKPVHRKLTKNGKYIDVYRGGIRDTNKYLPSGKRVDAPQVEAVRDDTLLDLAPKLHD